MEKFEFVKQNLFNKFAICKTVTVWELFLRRIFMRFSIMWNSKFFFGAPKKFENFVK